MADWKTILRALRDVGPGLFGLVVVLAMLHGGSLAILVSAALGLVLMAGSDSPLV